MKVVLINLGLFGSTGRIMFDITKMLSNERHNSCMIYPENTQNYIGNDNDFIIKGKFNRKLNAFFEKISGLSGCFSFWNTNRIIKFINSEKPDIIHLHNIHGMKINHGMLFSFLKKANISIVWTLHDCWALTGHCPHFSMVGCDKWKTGCYHCPQYKDYPSTYVDGSLIMWKRKKKWFNDVNKMTLVTPSIWLSDLVKQSYLKEYSIRVISNGIDLNVFKPFQSNFKEKYNLNNKYIVLGVAYGWSERKGLDVFCELARKLDEKYQIVLVGTTEVIDKALPDNIISIHRTQNQLELAEIYTAADVFVNPTREEVLGLVNLEALACGTPVVTFNAGGSPECIDDACGSVVEIDDIVTLMNEIIRICETKPYSPESCTERAKIFDKNKRILEYINLYKEIINE